MPTRIDLRLKATWSVRPDTKSLHGLACALFEGEPVPQTQHVAQEKPWTVTPLQPAEDGTADEWILRAAWLPDTAPPLTEQDIDSVRVGHTTCVVVETAHRRVTHAALAAVPPLRNVTVEFASPTYFSRNGEDVATPDPRLIVGSWSRRWNTSLPPGSPYAITEDQLKDLHRALALTKFTLSTTTRDSGHAKPRTGFTGEATLTLSRAASPRSRTLLATLSRFAEYSGTGAQTTHGFGTTTLIHPS